MQKQNKKATGTTNTILPQEKTKENKIGNKNYEQKRVIERDIEIVFAKTKKKQNTNL